VKRFRRAYYDLFSHFYDWIIALHSQDESSAVRDFLAERTGAGEGDRLLDLCTGTGAVALRTSRDTGPHGLTAGVDFSRGMIRKAVEKARRNGAEGLHFLVADVTHLPLRSGAFDAVTCSHAMYELSPEVRADTLAEARRVLRPGGRFLMMEHCEPARPFIRFLYHVRLATMGSARNRSFARDERPFLRRFFATVQQELSPSGRSKLLWGLREGEDDPSV